MPLHSDDCIHWFAWNGKSFFRFHQKVERTNRAPFLNALAVFLRVVMLHCTANAIGFDCIVLVALLRAAATAGPDELDTLQAGLHHVPLASVCSSSGTVCNFDGQNVENHLFRCHKRIHPMHQTLDAKTTIPSRLPNDHPRGGSISLHLGLLWHWFVVLCHVGHALDGRGDEFGRRILMELGRASLA